MNSLFAYGTLMFPEIAKRIAGITAKAEGAALKGYSRYEILDREFAKVPAIVQDAEGKVDGLLYDRISAESFKHLDRFEGVEDGDYKRVLVKVETKEGEKEAYAYVLDRSRNLGGAWDPIRFERECLSYYVENIVPLYELDKLSSE